MLKVVHHKQDTGQQLVGHQQMVDVCTSVVLTAVTGAPSYERSKVFPVPERKSQREPGSEDDKNLEPRLPILLERLPTVIKALLGKAQGVL